MRALVFRSAYSASRNARASAAFAASIKAHRAVSSKTLMLQVRCAHPPMPHRTSSSSCSGVPVGLFSEKALQLFLQNARPSAAARPPMGGGSFAPPCTPLSCPGRTDLSSVQKTPHLFSDGQTGGNSARRLLFPLPEDSLPVISRQPALRRLTFPAARPAPQSGRRRRQCRSKA